MFNEQSSVISSYLGWWADAGLADPVADVPMDWLTAPLVAASPAKLSDSGVTIARAAAPRMETPAALATRTASPVFAATMPDSLADFDQWLADHPALPGFEWSAARVLPHGPVDAPLMILSDAPDVADIEGQRLFCGAPGRLLDAMLTAIGQSRDTVRLGSIAFTRPPAGRLDGDEAQQLLTIAHRHIALAQPQRLLLLGQQTCQLLTGDVVPPDGRGQRQINHLGANTAAIAVHHPRLLIERPLLKRSAWTAMKCLKELSST